MNKIIKNKEDAPSSFYQRFRAFVRNILFIKPKNIEDVTEVLESSLSSDIIDEVAFSIAENAIKLRATSVKEIMIPKVEMVNIYIDDSSEKLLETVIESGHSRYPVINEKKKKVEGILLAKDLLPLLSINEEVNLDSIMRDAKVVPETKRADSLLEEFKKDKSHLAVVIDEYGEICGLVTIEDILEELVGEIEDEHDIDDLDLIQVSEKEFIADAKIEIDEFEEKFEINLNESSVETLGGYMTKKLGILPKVGDKIIVESIELVVTAADKRRIKKIGISIIT
ncbi:MAG: cobalt transporter [Gammaproteobacteria bacterium]|jgi:magnesium and cobalt transporter|nr:CBS domain-containing protein [Pseudomonadota bacterium]MDC2983369.1 CBS domain-containing protein [Pseudomonadota bacterium]GIR02334.1 MAG: cobalt transporter [Gammaproteobacteria bacterium]GIS35108.1 MAG: cobalt transporter [Gammaproteobacteria bacterium]|tara:strand:- start:353 stop:1198 length:846 start_codon:yes stop_codon:yes gene_type:complete